MTIAVVERDSNGQILDRFPAGITRNYLELNNSQNNNKISSSSVVFSRSNSGLHHKRRHQHFRTRRILLWLRRPLSRFQHFFSVENFRQGLIDIFLPTGYPLSVSVDYIDYQIYDSVQAFASTIAGLLANRAVLTAVGVGDTTASGTSALFMKIVQDTTGRLATILFAWRLGHLLEDECKKYRFMADIVNDSAMISDCLAPLYPMRARVFILCVSGVLRSICGVMASGSRAALTLHFTDPTRGSVADVNAKDASQETVVSLVGTVAGSLVVSWIAGPIATWVWLLSLITLHLWTNYRAVRSVIVKTLNRQRATILFGNIFMMLPDVVASEKDTGKLEEAQSIIRSGVLTPTEVGKRESILNKDGLLFWPTSATRGYGAGMRNSVVKYVDIGVAKFGPLKSILTIIPYELDLQDLLEIFNQQGYLLWAQWKRKRGPGKKYYTFVAITLKENHHLNDPRLAWAHALLVARKMYQTDELGGNTTGSSLISIIKETLDQMKTLFLPSGLNLEQWLIDAGWDLTRPAFAVSTCPRIKVISDNDEGKIHENRKFPPSEHIPFLSSDVEDGGTIGWKRNE